MRLRWYLSALVYVPFLLFAMLVAPLLPAFATVQRGPTDNNNGPMLWEPRLPRWLKWFMTVDNSLWGDYNWKHAHSGGYWSQVCWLWRNPAYGFAIALGIDPKTPGAYENNFTWWVFRCRTGWLLSGGLVGMFLLSIREK